MLLSVTRVDVDVKIARRKEMLKTSDLSKDIKTEEGLQKGFKLFRIHLFWCKTLFCMLNIALLTNSV